MNYSRCIGIVRIISGCICSYSNRGCTSGLVVKVLACNRKVAGSILTRCRLFSQMSIFSSTLKMRRSSSVSWLTCANSNFPISVLIPTSPLATFGNICRKIKHEYICTSIIYPYMEKNDCFITSQGTTF